MQAIVQNMGFDAQRADRSDRASPALKPVQLSDERPLVAILGVCLRRHDASDGWHFKTSGHNPGTIPS